MRVLSATTVGVLCLVLGVVVMALFTSYLPVPELFASDSRSYLNWTATRTPGYPLFLKAIQSINPEFQIVPYIQMLFFVTSCALVAAAGHLLRPVTAGWILFFLAVVGNPFLWRYAMMMLTESLYISLTMLAFAFAMFAVSARPRGYGFLIAAGLMLGFAILVRPVGYALLVALPFVALAWRNHWPRAGVAILGPALACLLLASLWNYNERGVFATQSFAGYNFLGHSFFLVPDSAEAGSQGDIGRMIAGDISQVSTLIRGGERNWREHYWLTAHAYNIALWRHSAPTISRTLTSRDQRETIPADELAVRVNSESWRIASAAIRHDPVAYAKHVLIHYYALWTFPEASSSPRRDEMLRLLCSAELSAFYICHNNNFGSYIVLPRPAEVAKDVIFAAVMLLSLGLILLGLTQRMESPTLVIAAMAALFINANHSLVALVEPGIARYALAAWPFLCLMSMTSLILVLDRIKATGKRVA